MDGMDAFGRITAMRLSPDGKKTAPAPCGSRGGFALLQCAWRRGDQKATDIVAL
ncbi:hypothetical protein BRI6_0394 [plant metagenome]|uniref:Uncharacterized protein n=1 Tax=plant metagenome TaxID=1297885 RepID=A0A484S432_9ZZZZ